MADMGRALISKIVTDGNVTLATEAGIQADWFEDLEHSTAFRWIVEFFSRHGNVPTADALKGQFPNYRLLDTPDPYDYYVECVKDQRVRAIITDTIIDANTAIQDDDPVLAQLELAKGLARLGAESTTLTDVDAIATMDDRYDGYVDAAEDPHSLTGITTGFPTLDWATSGWHPQNFVVIGGQGKQGKSWMLMAMAIAAQAAGNKVLFISFEMSVREQLARYDGMTCGVNSTKLLYNNMEDEDFKKLDVGQDILKKMKAPPFIISSDTAATTTVSALAGKVDRHKPDLLIVDGAYLMESENGEPPGSTQAMTAVSRGLKRLAQRIEIPVLATTQALPGKVGKGGEVTMGSLGWTSAWGQDADLILGVERVEKSPVIKLRIVSARNASPREIGLAVNWNESIIVEADTEEDDGE
jgi:archaellum biogenesis ATPase FlaH